MAEPMDSPIVQALRALQGGRLFPQAPPPTQPVNAPFSPPASSWSEVQADPLKALANLVMGAVDPWGQPKGLNTGSIGGLLGAALPLATLVKGERAVGAMPKSNSWFHGTSAESGLGHGDWFDPSLGNFESTVWLTGSKDHARQFAQSRAALDEAPSPVVFSGDVSKSARIKTIQSSSDIEADLRAARSEGYDALHIVEGEGGHEELAVLTGRAVKANHSQGW